MKKITAFLKTFIITKSSLFAICSLSILFSFPFIVFVISGAFVNLCKEEAEKMYGRFDNLIYNVSSEDDLEKIVNFNYYVDFYGTIEIFDANNDLSIGTIDENAVVLGSIHLIMGEFPQNDKEICMCESLYYELYSACNIGSIILINNQTYQLVGLINDYSVTWNKPVQDTDNLFPNVIIGGSLNEPDCRKIFLLKNRVTFPADIYKNQKNIVSNTNVLNGDLGEKYKAPDFIYWALYISILIVLIYIFLFINNNDKHKIEILNMVGVSKSFLKRFIVYKYICLSVISVLGGKLISDC